MAGGALRLETGGVAFSQKTHTFTDFVGVDLVLRIAANDSYLSWSIEKVPLPFGNYETALSMNSVNYVMLFCDIILWKYWCLGNTRVL